MIAPRLALLLASALGACSGDVNPVRDTLVDSGVGAKPRPAPEFIERSRPQDLDYLPVGVAPPPRRTAAKSEEEVRRAAAEMEAARGRNQAQAEAARRAAGAPAPQPR
jgi:hypothetical protein